VQQEPLSRSTFADFLQSRCVGKGTRTATDSYRISGKGSVMYKNKHFFETVLEVSLKFANELERVEIKISQHCPGSDSDARGTALNTHLGKKCYAELLD